MPSCATHPMPSESDMNPITPLRQLSDLILAELSEPLHQLGFPERTHRLLPLAEQVHTQIVYAERLVDHSSPMPAAKELKLAVAPLYRLMDIADEEEMDDDFCELLDNLEHGIDEVFWESLRDSL